jgi:hypothetical protein
MLTGCNSGDEVTSGNTGSGIDTNNDGEVLSSQMLGFALPTELSAVPASNVQGATVASTAPQGKLTKSVSFATALRQVAAAEADLAPSSDYAQTTGAKYIEEPALDRFAIIEQVLQAVGQTRYADAANINKGPYKAMIAWADEKNGVQVKTLEPWVVDSRMIVIDGQDVNRVLAWIEESDPEAPDGISLVKAEFKIYQAATLDVDGKILDYGKWELNVKFSEDGSDFFVATCEPNPAGGSIIKVNEHEEMDNGIEGMKGVLYRAGASGYGKVRYPDWEGVDWQSCGENCTPATPTAQYAYNADYLGTRKDDAAPVYKDRNNSFEMTHNYGLFYDENPPAGITAGDDVKKHNQFGFPLTYTNELGHKSFAYYGAWQGRHQIWANGGDGQGVPAGTEVFKEAWGAGVQVKYTVAASLQGTFTKRTYVDASLADIQNVPVETWLNKNFTLFYNDSNNWQQCENGWVEMVPPNEFEPPSPPLCRGHNGEVKDFTPYTPGPELIVAPEDRKNVNIDQWDHEANTQKRYVYLNDAVPIKPAAYAGEGFYNAVQGEHGKMVAADPAVKYLPEPGDQLNINMGGSIYIAYTGQFEGLTTTGWVQKELVSFDDRNWRPVFGTTDTPFTPDMGREYYMNSNGVNYVVKRKAIDNVANSYDVLLEVQTTANPANCTAGDCSKILPAAADYLRTPWDMTVRYALVTDAADPNYLLLTYLTNDPNTPGDDTGMVYQQGGWGLQAWSTNDTETTADDFPIDASGNPVAVDDYGMPTGATRPVEFNWEYSESGGWGAQQYLLDGDLNYVILDDPIMLAQITVATNVPDVTKNLLLQFDGWMHGLPDMHDALKQADWDISNIWEKIINIPAGTAVTDSNGIGYYLKPLQTSIFLAVVSAETEGLPDLSQADSIDLDLDTPTFTDHGMGDMPAVTTVKYSEGVLVE